MKPVLLAFLIITINSVSFAQLDSNQIAQSSFSTKPNPLFVQPYTPLQKEWLPPGYRMRKVGATLTLSGIFLVVGGVIVKNTSLAASSVMYVHGAGMIIPGIVFWTRGATSYKIYQAEQAATNASLRFIGNGVAYRF